MKHPGRLLAFLLVTVALHAPADDQIYRTPIVDQPAGTVGLGFGYRIGTPAYRDIDRVGSVEFSNKADLVPLYLYEGKYVFLHGTSAGVHVFDNETFRLNLLARYRFDRLEPVASDYFDGMLPREQTTDGGVDASIMGAWGEFSATWLTDLHERHEGEEVTLTWRYTLSPMGRWTLSPFASWVHQDDDLVNYYYGVQDKEARQGRPAFQPGAGDSYRLGLNANYQLTRGWVLHGALGFETIPDSAKGGPLTTRDHNWEAMVGASYFYDGSIYNAKITTGETERQGEWMWRVNAGYGAERPFHSMHRGYIQPSTEADTYQMGLTVGRLIKAGERVSFYGRAAVYRHFEGDLQEDFFEYAAFAQAMGRGYSPWSGTELFRYGLGFGVSYADRPPIVEQIHQAEKGNEAHRLSAYLDAQIDFPIARMFKTKSLRNCYVGVSLIHRSGIFSFADIFGNVDGGSDVFAGHIECVR